MKEKRGVEQKKGHQEKFGEIVIKKGEFAAKSWKTPTNGSI